MHCYQNFYTPNAFTIAQVNLRNRLRMLWEQHDVWTWSTIISIVFDLPLKDAVVARLLRNPVDFEQVLQPFYGKRIAAEFRDLLTEHLVIAAELVEAAKAGDNKAAEDAERRWYANADAIAVFLGRINPFWSQEQWRSMMFRHLALVKAEAVNMLSGNYEESIAAYDANEIHTLEMADVMAEGIIKQFNIC